MHKSQKTFGQHPKMKNKYARELKITREFEHWAEKKREGEENERRCATFSGAVVVAYFVYK